MTLLVLSLSLAACSDGAFGTNVPPETVLDEATPENLSDLCVAISNELLSLAAGPVTRTICTVAGVAVDSELVSCREVRSECIEQAEAPEVTSCGSISQDAFDACDTTVAEVESCVNQLRSNVRALEDQVSCSLDRADLEDLDADNLFPEQCTEIGIECPALGMLLNFQVDLDPDAGE